MTLASVAALEIAMSRLWNRRAVLASVLVSPAVISAADQTTLSVGRWMELARIPEDRALRGVLSLTRFRDEIYVVNSPTSWVPKAGSSLSTVTVPSGFVTDLASVPRVFFGLFRPDGQYAHAAVVHDWLYWAQSSTRAIADDIFDLAMVDLGVSSIERRALFEAVAAFGQKSWDENGHRKRKGERRVLRVFPSDPLTTWAEWRTKAGVFAD